jgi:hypothetical protein
MSECQFTAKVCMNGHCVFDSVEITLGDSSNCCKECGASLITNCPVCNAKIKEHHEGPSQAHVAPGFCHECGAPFPWHKKECQ